MQDKEKGFDQQNPEQVLKRKRYGNLFKPGIGDLKNQLCSESGISNNNKTSHYLSRIQMTELLTYIRNLKQIIEESKRNEPEA